MDKSKHQFEAFINDGDYPWLKASIPIMWMVWKASRESLINSLEPVGYISEDGLNSLSENSDAITSSKQQYNKVIPIYKLD